MLMWSEVDFLSDLSSRLELSKWSQLQFLELHLSHDHRQDWWRNAIKLLDSVDIKTCKRITIHFQYQEPDIVRVIQRLPHRNSDLESALLKFSRVDMMWNVWPGLRTTRNSFWAREFKTYFPALSQHPGATFVLRSETGEPLECCFQPTIFRDKLMVYAVLTAGHDGHVSAVVVSPDSNWIASGSYDSTIIVWDTLNGSIAWQWAFPNYQEVYCLAFSPDSRYLLSGGVGGTAVIWDLSDSARMVTTLEEHLEAVTGCAWSPDGTIIATASSDTPLQLWDSNTFHVLHAMREGSMGFCPSYHPRVTFSPDGHWLASACCTSSYCWIWDVPQGVLHNVVLQQDHSPRLSIFDPVIPIFNSTSTRLITTPVNNRVEILDIETDSTLSVAPDCGFGIRAASFSPDGKLVLAASPDGVKVWDLDSGIELSELKGHGICNGVRDAHFSPCGKYIACGGDGYIGVLWRISDGTLVVFSEHKSWVTHVAFSPDGQTVMSAAFDGSVVIRRMCDIIRV